MAKTLKLILVVFALCQGLSAQADREHQLKAAFIFNFAKYIQWPQGLGEPNAPFVIGVYGMDSYCNEVSHALTGKLVSGHPIVVVDVEADSSVRNCRILVTGASTEERVSQLLRLCRASSTVLVGDAPDFVSMGGTVGFAIESGKVRFDVNLVTARGESITISSKMLSLARTVIR